MSSTAAPTMLKSWSKSRASPIRFARSERVAYASSPSHFHQHHQGRHHQRRHHHQRRQHPHGGHHDLGRRHHQQSLSRFISPEETREFTAALREVVERGVTRNARLNPRSASGEGIPTTLNASALRDSDGKVIGALGILRDMRELDKARAYAESLIKNAPDPMFVSDLEGKILQANDAVFALLGFRADELIEQSLSRIISPAETR